MSQNINNPKTALYPFWTPPFDIQNPRRIVGGAIDSMLEDLQSYRIPSETDYLNAPVRTIPIPKTNIDTQSVLKLETHRTQLGRGSAISLADMLLMSQLEVNQIGGNE